MPVFGLDGTGCVMLDVAYDAYENYRMIRNSDRRPVNDPRKDHALKGYNPRAEMLRWKQKNSEEFERTYSDTQKFVAKH